jgi:hypothetical protein
VPQMMTEILIFDNNKINNNLTWLLFLLLHCLKLSQKDHIDQQWRNWRKVLR